MAVNTLSIQFPSFPCFRSQELMVLFFFKNSKYLLEKAFQSVSFFNSINTTAECQKKNHHQRRDCNTQYPPMQGFLPSTEHSHRCGMITLLYVTSPLQPRLEEKYTGPKSTPRKYGCKTGTNSKTPPWSYSTEMGECSVSKNRIDWYEPKTRVIEYI